MREERVRGRRPVNFYDVLQVAPEAHPTVIDASYRVLARLYHPDVSRDPNAAHSMRDLNAAYDILSHPARRAQYDAERTRFMRSDHRRSGRPPSIATDRRSATENGREPPRPVHSGRTAFRAWLAFVIFALLAALTTALWLIIEMLGDRPASAFAV